jgi:hypothetical protein
MSSKEKVVCIICGEHGNEINCVQHWRNKITQARKDERQKCIEELKKWDSIYTSMTDCHCCIVNKAKLKEIIKRIENGLE